jgi:aldehyde:ferredoxin oxidoreductase
LRAFFETQKVWSAYNSVGVCDFVSAPLNGLELQPMVDYVNPVTGWNMSIYEVMKLGERNTLAREFLPLRRRSLDAERGEPRRLPPRGRPCIEQRESRSTAAGARMAARKTP